MVKTLCLRGGREHKALKLSQFTSGCDEGGEYIVYTENGSKNKSGIYKDKPDQNKVIKHYADPALDEKCYIAVLKLYFSKLPTQLFEYAASVFYVLETKREGSTSISVDGMPWFVPQLIGRNVLASMVKNV